MRAMAAIHPLKTFREQHDPPLSQEDLAGLLGVTRVTITRWEARRRTPDRRLLPKIAKVTGLKPALVWPDLADILTETTV
jgi:transcriptional regulator with XRE-family HTH domain